MKKIFSFTILTALFIVFFVGKLSAQVTIGADVPPKPYAVLELVAQYETGIFGGLRLPQLTTEQRDALTGLTESAAKGLTIYNTTTDCIDFWNGTEWKSICDGSTGGGTTPGTQGKCGAYIAPGEWKEFLCYNLGANYGADPFSPSSDLNGDYYQWGSSTPAATRDYIIGTWSSTAPTTFWGDGTDLPNSTIKSIYDPCPAGYRVPTYAEWQGVINNNTITWIDAGNNSGYMVGNFLFLPTTGYRDASNGALHGRGTSGYYWSSRMYNATFTYNAGFINSGHAYMDYGRRAHGEPIRCIAE